MAENKTNELQTINQVCELLQVSRNTLIKYVDEGYLNAFKLPGGAWRFKAEDINEFLRNGQIKNK